MLSPLRPHTLWSFDFSKFASSSSSPSLYWIPKTMPLSLRLALSPTALAPTTSGFGPSRKQCRIPYSGVATTKIGLCSLDSRKRGDSSVVRCSLETVNVSVGQVTEVDKDTFWPIVKAAGEKIVVLDMYTQWYLPLLLLYFALSDFI